MKALDQLRAAVAQRKVADAGAYTTYSLPVTGQNLLADAVLELADEQAAHRYEQRSQANRAGMTALSDPALRARAQAFANKITGAAVDHAKAIKDAYEAARRHGWNSDDETLAEWINRREAQIGEAAARHGWTHENGERIVAFIDRQGERVKRYSEQLKAVQSAVSPDNALAPFDQLPELVARSADGRDLAARNERQANILRGVATALGHSDAPDWLPVTVAEVVYECQTLQEENAVLRAAPSPLKVYVVAYLHLHSFVLAENADEALSYVVSKTDVGAPPYTVTPVDMTKPGILGR